MKASLVILTAAATLGLAAPASAAAPPSKQITALQQQVRTLQTQVKLLQKETRVLRATVDSNQEEAQKAFGQAKVGEACLALAVADVFQSTWTAVGPPFGAQEPLGDVSCKAIGVTRPGIQAKPSVDVFWALTGWLIG